MPKVHFVKKARKPIEHAGIQVGDSYYWWKFRFGGKRVSKTRPNRSQLTQSGFLSQLYDLEDGIDARLRSHVDDDGGIDSDEVKGELDSIADDLESLKDECEESLENMPENLRESSWSAELLQERIDALEEWSEGLRSIHVDEDSDIDSVADEASDCNPGCS